MYPIVGIVAYDEEGEQQFGRTAVLPDMPDSALEFAMMSIFWHYVSIMNLSWEEAAELAADIHIKAQYTFQQGRADDLDAGPGPGSPIEALTSAFERAAGRFLEDLHRSVPGMNAIAAAVLNDKDNGCATAAAGPDISPEEWEAMLKTLLGPAVRDGQLTADQLRSIFDEVIGSIVLEATKPKPLLS